MSTATNSLSKQAKLPNSQSLPATGRPLRIFIFPSNVCNNDCQCCFLGDKRPARIKGWQEVKRVIDRWLPFYSSLSIGGGEPTLYPHIVKLISYAKHKGLKVNMFSNCRRLADEGLAHSLVEAGLDSVIVTLHGHTPKLHDSLTRSRGSFEQTIQGMYNLSQSPLPELQLQVIIQRQNYGYLPQILELGRGLGVDSYSFQAVIFQGQTLRFMSELGVKLSATVPFLENAFDMLIQGDYPFYTCSYPLCLVNPRYWGYIRNMRTEREIHTSNWMMGGEGIAEEEIGLALAPVCASCMLNRRCPGTWETYYEFWGDSELDNLRAARALRAFAIKQGDGESGLLF